MRHFTLLALALAFVGCDTGDLASPDKLGPPDRQAQCTMMANMNQEHGWTWEEYSKCAYGSVQTPDGGTRD